MDSLAFLERPPKKVAAVYVVYGNEDFLKRQVLRALRARLLEGAENQFCLSTYTGDSALFAEIHNDLHTVPFLGPRRLVLVEQADSFVTRFRAQLEKYVASPAQSGVLILEVRSWPATTRLAKLIESASTIVCKTPQVHRLPDWCLRWAASRYACQMSLSAARLLVELVGPDMGPLDQELAKLSIYVGSAAKIDVGDVDTLVGRSRVGNTFKIFDAVVAGKAREAMAILDRVLDQGDDPLRVLGAFSMHLRRLAQAARQEQQGVPLGQALAQAGVPPFAQQTSAEQILLLGRRRLDRLYDWLLEADSSMKGGSELNSRLVLERLLVRLAAPEASPSCR